MAWDAPGCGESSDPPPSFKTADYGRSLAGLLRGLGLADVHVVGLSFGSTVALELYRSDPGLVRSLTLAGGYAGWAGSLAPDEVARRLEGALRDLDSSPEALVQAWTPTLFAREPPKRAVEELTAMMASLRTAGAGTMVRAMAACDLRDLLPSVTVPTLVLHGAEDVRSPDTVAQALAAAIPGATLVVLEGVGHMSNLEAPERFNAELLSFLRAQTPRQ